MRGLENDRQWEAAEDILNQIRARVSMDIRSNRQALMRRDVLLRWHKGEFGNDRYCRQMCEILEMTIPFDDFLKEGEKYLTYEEQTCIQNMLQGFDGDREIVQICMKRFENIYWSIIDNELQEAFAGVFELIMSFVGSELGNRGEYDRSDQFSEVITQGCLRFRRLGGLSDSLYNRWWNYAERKRKNILTNEPLDAEKELYTCVLLSRLSRQKDGEIFFKRKLEQIREDN